MDENPYKSPADDVSAPPTAPAGMLRSYRLACSTVYLGTGGAFLLAGLAFPPCSCGFAAMPGWLAAAILLSWLTLVVLIGAAAATTISLGMILWLKHGVRCPAMVATLACFVVVIGLSLPLLPCGRRSSVPSTPKQLHQQRRTPGKTDRGNDVAAGTSLHRAASPEHFDPALGVPDA